MFKAIKKWFKKKFSKNKPEEFSPEYVAKLIDPRDRTYLKEGNLNIKLPKPRISPNDVGTFKVKVVQTRDSDLKKNVSTEDQEKRPLEGFTELVAKNQNVVTPEKPKATRKPRKPRSTTKKTAKKTAKKTPKKSAKKTTRKSKKTTES